MIYWVHFCGHVYFLYTSTFLVYLSACFLLFSPAQSVTHVVKPLLREEYKCLLVW